MKGISLLLLLGCISAAAAEVTPKMIYGEDDRVEASQDMSVQSLAASTVAMVHTSELNKMTSGGYTYTAPTFGERMGLCEGERFREQPSLSHCSGFLVAPDMVATAGHCIDQFNCAQKSVVFNYRMKDAKNVITEFNANEVYHCKSIVKREKIGTGQDYAVIKLDRPVVGFKPLKLKRSNTTLQKGDKIFVIGYPMGLPLKIAKNALVRSWSADKSFFVAGLDTYGGNSGSAVFNQTTNEVEGILVRGDTDLVSDSDNSCVVSNRCTDEYGCRGEDVTNISFVTKVVPQKIKVPSRVKELM